MPRKKQKIHDIRSYFSKSGNAGSSFNPTESSQPGGAAGGAAGPQVGGAAGPQVGGAAGPQVGGAAGPQVGGAAGPQVGGAAGPQVGGAAGPQVGGAAGSRVGGAAGPQVGGAAGPQVGGAAGPQVGGAAGPQVGGAAGPQVGGAAGSRVGGAAGPQVGGVAGGAAGPQTETPSQVKVKTESDGGSTDEHLHRFSVRFSCVDRYRYPVGCDQPRTVLEVIKSTEKYNKKMKKKCVNENIVIQLGKEDKESIVATHFPCSCIRDGETVIISCESQKVEEAPNPPLKTIHSRSKYSVFYIDTVGGLHTRTKELFRNTAVKKFKYLCVYGEKGMTVEEALRNDGRFVKDLGDFTLSDNENPNYIIERTQKVDNLNQKSFKIRLPRNIRRSDEKLQNNPVGSEQVTKPVLDIIRQRGVSVRSAVEESGNRDRREEIYEILRQQFPDLKEWMEKRFTGDSFQEALNLKREEFGKIQQSFSEVHRVKKLLKVGESVCKVVVGDICVGTGFVLFDNYILTNAHLFKDCIKEQYLKEGVNVFVLFNYEDPEPHTNYYFFQVAQSYIHYSEGDLDYAILELNPEGQRPNQTPQTKKIKVPPGLLKTFSPLPSNGEACIIGHPEGGLKKLDPTFVIEKEKRKQAVDDHLHPHKDSLFSVHSIFHLIKAQGIENIMMGGSRAEKVVTYNTFMYHGSSGSPVFDAHCRVFGLHTAGYVYGFPNNTKSVIEFAQPVLTIFEHFVSQLKENKDEELLERVKKEAKGNTELEKILDLLTDDSDEPADIDE